MPNPTRQLPEKGVKMTNYHSLEWLSDKTLRLLDQRVIPQAMEYLETQDYHQVAEMIRDMAVRGAPAIGVAAAMQWH